MKNYNLDELAELGLLSEPLKSMLYDLDCKTVKEILSFVESKSEPHPDESSYHLNTELIDLVDKLNLGMPFLANGNIANNQKKEKFTVNGYVEKLLNESDVPIKLDVLVEKIKVFIPETHIMSIRANISGDRNRRFMMYLGGYVGLRGKVYDKQYVAYSISNKKRQNAEDRILEFIAFVEEKHRSPQPHGLEEEESLYHWYQRFIKNITKETEEQYSVFLDFLKEYDQWIYSPKEYSYKRLCDQLKWYVDENVELPTLDKEPELYSWFNSQLKKHAHYKDKRKAMFKELLKELELYGLRFFTSRTLKRNSSSSHSTFEFSMQAENELPCERFIRFLENLKNDFDTNENAAHKALLLVSIINLIQKGNIESEYIFLDNELLTEFADVYMEYTGTASSCNIASPFYHLNNEPFWDLIPAEGYTYDDVDSISAPSFDTLERTVRCAVFDKELFVLLNDNNFLMKVRELLTRKYLA